MKKLFVLAMMATLLMAGSAFAIQRNFVAAPNATFSTAVNGGPSSTNNDDTCDIAVAPAATLLLPYFEVSSTQGGVTTLFAITNVSSAPQIAHVTVWTEYSIPVLDFNIFLTGYDVQTINLYDVIFLGTVAGSGTSVATTKGSLSASNTANPNFAGAGASIAVCASLPGQLPTSLMDTVRTALTTGSYTGCTAAGSAGGNHAGIAKGYITIDVANTCSTKLPTDAGYFAGGATAEILYDNVLIGDYQQLGPVALTTGFTTGTFDGAGNPMIHIRAIPEGGPSNSGIIGSLSFTFYDRYTPTALRQGDRRQPLPSTWAARYIENPGNLATNFKIWREGTSSSAACSSATVTNNRDIPITEIVRFDEAENPFTPGGSQICSPCQPTGVTLPETSLTATTNSVYPQFPSSSAASKFGGWMYLNLSNGGSAAYSVRTSPALGSGMNTGAAPTGVALAGPRPSQNWVTIEMFGNINNNRMAVDFDAAWLGNGCSPGALAAGTSAPATIGPAGGVFVCPAGASCTGTYSGTNVTP